MCHCFVRSSARTARSAACLAASSGTLSRGDLGLLLCATASPEAVPEQAQRTACLAASSGTLPRGGLGLLLCATASSEAVPEQPSALLALRQAVAHCRGGTRACCCVPLLRQKQCLNSPAHCLPCGKQWHTARTRSAVVYFLGGWRIRSSCLFNWVSSMFCAAFCMNWRASWSKARRSILGWRSVPEMGIWIT